MKNFILKQIESGKKIKGLKGFIRISSTAECGTGSRGTAFVPVEITKMKSKDCGQIQICVKLLNDHHIEKDEPQEWEISPAGFYESTTEIDSVMKHREAVSQYNQAVSCIGNRGYGSRLVSQRRDSLIDLYNRSTDEAKAIIDKELVEKGTTLKKVDSAWFDNFAKILAKPLYFPNVKPDEDVDESEEWED